jgi:hypothetical protein
MNISHEQIDWNEACHAFKTKLFIHSFIHSNKTLGNTIKMYKIPCCIGNIWTNLKYLATLHIRMYVVRYFTWSQSADSSNFHQVSRRRMPENE